MKEQTWVELARLDMAKVIYRFGGPADVQLPGIGARRCPYSPASCVSWP